MVVDKAGKRFHLIETEPGGHRVIASYPVSTGRSHGDKERSGDGRTPEGAYRIDRVEGYRGCWRFRLDYPNAEDRRKGKTGSGIFIHQAAGDRAGQSNTDGCITLRHDDILDLRRRARTGTRVFIFSHIEDLSRAVSENIIARSRKRETEEHSYVDALEILRYIIERYAELIARSHER